MNRHIRKWVVLLSAILSLTILWAAPAVKAQTGGVYLRHVATAGNIVGNWSYIDDFRLNNHPDDRVVMVTQNWSGVGVYNNNPIAAGYDRWRNQWAVFNANGAPMPLNATFNIYADLPTPKAFKHETSSPYTSAAAYNISGNSTFIDNPRTNGHPEMLLFVTAVYDWSHGWSLTNYNRHSLGVRYEGGKWAICNLDGSYMPQRATFHVFAYDAGELLLRSAQLDLFTHSTTMANTLQNFTRFDITRPAISTARRWPDTFAFVTAKMGPNSVLNNHTIGVWYTGQVWSVFNQDWQNMPLGATFNVWLWCPHL